MWMTCVSWWPIDNMREIRRFVLRQTLLVVIRHSSIAIVDLLNSYVDMMLIVFLVRRGRVGFCWNFRPNHEDDVGKTAQTDHKNGH